MTLEAFPQFRHFAPWLLPCVLALSACGGGSGGSPGTTASGTGSSGGSPPGTSTPAAANAGSISWTEASATWPDMGAAAVATVTRSGGSEGTVTVAYGTRDGTAVAGTDYTSANGILTWGNKNARSKTVAILLGSKAHASGAVDMSLVLSNPTGGATVPSSGRKIKLTLNHEWKVPATLAQFDLSKWRLDLPVDANGGTGGANNLQLPADAILPNELSTTYVGPYFYGDAQGRIVFTAPANGAVTTPGSGSNHTRSELHEVYTGPGADANGDWTTGKGTLTATCTVQAVASASDVAIIGQLRGQNSDLALVLYRPVQHDVAIDIYAASTSGSAHTRTQIVPNVNLGDPIAYTLAYDAGVLTATVNGITQSFKTGPTWSGVPLYFKLGAYHTAPNSGNAPNDVTMVAFSAFSVSH